MTQPEDLKTLLARLPIASAALDDSENRRLDELDAKRARDAKEQRARREALTCLESFPLVRSVREDVLQKRTQQTAAQVAVREWLDDANRKPFLLLLGGVGVGKTVAAATAALHFYGCLYISAPRLRATVTKELWGDDPNARVMRDSFVVLDDLGAEVDDQDKFDAALFELVNWRLDRATIITSNLTRKMIAERYDPRVIDRFLECAKVVELKDKESMRKRK